MGTEKGHSLLLGVSTSPQEAKPCIEGPLTTESLPDAHLHTILPQVLSVKLHRKPSEGNTAFLHVPGLLRAPSLKTGLHPSGVTKAWQCHSKARDFNQVFSFTAVKTAAPSPIRLNNGSVSAGLPW